MAGPVNFLKGLVGASTSQSSNKVKGKQVGRYDHRAAEAVDGKPILKESKEFFLAQADHLEKQAGQYRSKVAQKCTLEQAQKFRTQAENAKTSAQLQNEKIRKEQRSRMAEARKARQKGPLNQIKKAAVKVVDAVKHEAEEFYQTASQAVEWGGRQVRLVNEQDVLNNMIKQKDKLKWYKNPAESFQLWRDIRQVRARIKTLENEK
ncbi:MULTISPECIES: hypothetical protein [unclassified Endozoicomonas]|uniref:hypothetical protein n=1 Tax=unclassified Endozoicomonas TaxID=2644528 RepID=UPI003BB78936